MLLAAFCLAGCLWVTQGNKAGRLPRRRSKAVFAMHMPVLCVTGSTKLKFRRSLQESKESAFQISKSIQGKNVRSDSFPSKRDFTLLFASIALYLHIVSTTHSDTFHKQTNSGTNYLNQSLAKLQNFTPTAAQKRNNNQPCLHPPPAQPTRNSPWSTSTAPPSRASGPAAYTKTPKP